MPGRANHTELYFQCWAVVPSGKVEEGNTVPTATRRDKKSTSIDLSILPGNGRDVVNLIDTQDMLILWQCLGAIRAVDSAVVLLWTQEWRWGQKVWEYIWQICWSFLLTGWIRRSQF